MRLESDDELRRRIFAKYGFRIDIFVSMVTSAKDEELDWLAQQVQLARRIVEDPE